MTIFYGFYAFADHTVTGDGNECVYDTLNTYTGPATITANWRANTINLNWYDNNTIMTPSNTTANTCTYDNRITLPSTNPTKTGYTFTGWEVMSQYDFSTIPINIDGTKRWAKSNSCYYAENTDAAASVSCNSDTNFEELCQNEWKVKFNHGDLYGMAGCSNTLGTLAIPGDPTISDGIYCWCKATGYKITNSDTINAPTTNLAWVFDDHNSTTPANCISMCASRCASYAIKSAAFRTALYSAQQAN